MAKRPVTVSIRQILNERKDDLKHKEYKIPGGKVKILGIGPVSILASINGADEDFYWFDKPEGFIIATTLIKTFPNEVFNKEIVMRIKKHREVCVEKNHPVLTPKDGICWTCGEQVFTKEDGSEPVTGCPHCLKSFCD